MRATRLLASITLLLCLQLMANAQSGEISQYDRGTPPQHAAGVSAIGSYISADIGTVNLGNGSLNFALPIASVGGRGFWVPITLNYSSKLWSGRKGRNGSQNYVWAAYDDPGLAESPFYKLGRGWTVGAAPYIRVQGVGITPTPNGSCTNYFQVVTKLTVVMPDKGEIELRDDATDGAPLNAGPDPFPGYGCPKDQDGNRGRNWHATDGSGMVFKSDNDNGIVNGDLAGVLIVDGMRYAFENLSPNHVPSVYMHFTARCTSITDRNGNVIAIQYPNANEVDYLDQLGRITRIEFNVTSDPAGPLALRVTMPGYNNQSRYFKVKSDVMNQHWRSDYATTQEIWNGDLEQQHPGVYSLFAGSDSLGAERIDDKLVISQVILADGRTLDFHYNWFGEVAEVITPTGGKIQYDFSDLALSATQGLPVGNSLHIETFGGAGTGNVPGVDRAVTARRTYPDGSTLEGTWTYAYYAEQQSGDGTVTGNGSTTAKAYQGTTSGPLLLNEVHYFLTAQRYLSSLQSNPNGTGYSMWSTGLEYRVRSYDQSGINVLTAEETDWSQRAPVCWTCPSSAPEQPANDNRVNDQRRVLNSAVARIHNTYQDAVPFNNVIKAEEYDFDNTLKRRTETTYITANSYAGNNRRLCHLIDEQNVFDGNSQTATAYTKYEYDTYTQDADNNHAMLENYSGVTISGHDTSYDNQYLTRGNPTMIKRLITGSQYIFSYPRYDILGNTISTKDPNTNVTTISFVDDYGDGHNPGTGTVHPSPATYANPTLITSPLPNTGEPAQTAYSEYDYSTGLLVGFKDRNGTITQSFYNDAFDRPTEIIATLGVTNTENHTWMYYAPQTNPYVTLTANDVLTASGQNSPDDRNLRKWTKTDGFGRTKESWTHDAEGDVNVALTYDGVGRVKTASNPLRANDTQYDTTTTYDLAGRVTVVTSPDQATVGTAYSGNVVTVTDQAGKARSSVIDGLGRLVQVTEDPGTGHLGYVTNYTYDVLDDLKTVMQVQAAPFAATQTRTFSYDGLKRLTDATNPENGNVHYIYDNNGNLLTKLVTPRGITTTFTYDALDRVKSKSYQSDTSGTPRVDYWYDAQSPPALPAGSPTFNRGQSIGRLIAATYGGSGSNTGTYQGYDPMGRVVQSIQVTAATTAVAYGFTYSYNLASEMLTEVYPSGRTISMTYDATGRLNDLSGTKGTTTTTYASQLSYAAHGAMQAMTLGSSLVEKTAFNNRLQPTKIQFGTVASPSSVLELNYTFSNTNPNIHDNNGNVRTQQIKAPGMDVTQTYTYDALNRLSVAQEDVTGGANIWQQQYGYDRYGNRWYSGGNYLPNPTLTPQSQSHFDPGNNHLTMTNVSYTDGAGNLTHDAGTGAFTYDAENRQITANVNGQTASYAYDGDGRRVKKVVNGTSSVTTIFVYNATGQLIGEYTSDPVPPPAGGGGTSYLTSDHLGSTRVVTKQGGSVKARYDYLPFGEELGASVGQRTTGMGYGAPDSTRQKFTQKERDNESGLDYFLARYYSSAQGRFTSPDEFTGGPVELFNFAAAASNNPTFYADIQEPQSLNKYQYAYNNPLIYIDPNGHQGLRRKVEDIAIGAGKEIANNGIGFINLIGAMSRVSPEVKNASHIEEFKPSNGTQDVAMVITLVVSLAIPGPGEAKASVEAAELAARATEIHGVLGAITQTKTTTAVLEGVTEAGEITRLVASSENTLRPAQVNALRPGEVAVSGAGHAEETALNAATKMGIKPTSVAASRPICPACELKITGAGARAASPVKLSSFRFKIKKPEDLLKPQ